MKPRRRRPNKTEQTAAALLQIKRGEDWLIPEPLRSTGTAQQICASVQWHHRILPHAIGGGTTPQELEPLPDPEHKLETKKKTLPAIAKAKRLSKTHEEFRRKMLAKAGQCDPSPPSRATRPFPGSRASGWKSTQLQTGRNTWERRSK